MSAKLYFFPHDPEYRKELLDMPVKKRRKLLHLGNLRWRLLHNRLDRILAQRGRKEFTSQEKISE